MTYLSIDPADEGTLSGAFQMVTRKTMQGMCCALPASIIVFDRETNRAQVKPLIATLTMDNKTVSKSPIASVPVVQMGGGGFVVSCNLKPGDLGWIIAADRDISLFLTRYQEQRPNTNRMHDFADAFFIPDVMTGMNIDGEDEENFVIQKKDGTVKITLSNDSIKIKSTTKIEIESEEIKLTGKVDITGDVNISGKQIVQGLIASNNKITATLDITPFTPPPP